jgi:hypothetical protein
MTTRYMRAGTELQYLHLVGCRRYHWWHHALGKVVRWEWAERATRAELVNAVRAFDIKLCRSCSPLGVLRPVRTTR